MQNGTNDNPSQEKIDQRLDTYDRIIGLIDQHIESIPVKIVSDLTTLSPVSGKAAAERESWMLLKAGIEHLRRWGGNETQGPIAGAVKKASVLSSGLATSLGILPAQYQEPVLTIVHKNGFDEAQAIATELVDAVQKDLVKSKKEILSKVSKAPAPDDMSIITDLNDQQVKAIIEKIDLNGFDPSVLLATNSLPPKRPTDDFIQQAALAFNSLISAYEKVSNQLKQDINLLPPPAPPKAESRPDNRPTI